MYDSLGVPLGLLAACSYLPAGGAAERRQAALLAGEAPSPGAFWESLCRHRILGLADQVLERHGRWSLLGSHAPELRAAARRTRLAGLRLAAMTGAVTERLSTRGIAHSWLKGPGLSERLYGDASLRHSKDLDLLVAPAAVGATLGALADGGWVPIRHRGLWPRSRLYRWLAERRLRHLTLTHPAREVTLELHWRLETIHSPAIERTWRELWPPGAPPLCPGEILYLCLHGAQHAWIRFKWLGDLQAIAERRPELWTELAPGAARLRLEPILAQTRTLLETLYHPEGGEPGRLTGPLTAYALESLQRASADLLADPAAALAYRHYMGRLNRRFPAADRAVALCGLGLAGTIDLEGWSLPAAALPVIPFRQAARLVRRYWPAAAGR